VGNGNDFSAEVSGTTSWAEGSFPKVTNVTSETDGSVNNYALQLNTNMFSGASLCSGASSPANCQGWQQFIYAPGTAFMQYWLINYVNACPSGWMTYGPDCFKNSNGVSVPSEPVTNLANLTLIGQAGSSDTVFMSTGTGTLYAVSAGTVVNLNSHWQSAEFNVVGNANASEAVFNSGASIVVQTLTNSVVPTNSAPTCQSAGFTAETNNLNLTPGSCCPVGGTSPGIQFMESNATGATAQSCPLLGHMTDGIFRPASSPSSQAQWFLSNVNVENHTDVGPYNYGNGGDIPIVGDWDGDGTFTDGIFRPAGSANNPGSQAQWFLSNSNAPNNTDVGPFLYGNAGDLPVVGDWDGNGTFTVGIFRPAGSPNNPGSQAQWFLSNHNIANNTDIGPFYYGNAGDLPVVGDWNGDGTYTVGIFRPAGSPNNSSSQAQWFLNNLDIANNTDIGPFFYGNAGDIPIVGDWDGDSTSTVGIFRPAGSSNNPGSQAQWFLSNHNIANNTDIGPYYYGNAGDVPVVGRWVP
jgi:hypothetical protein